MYADPARCPHSVTTSPFTGDFLPPPPPPPQKKKKENPEAKGKKNKGHPKNHPHK